ncbi:MAG: TldD/PmbA family protein [Rectinema sp.]
MQKRSHSPFLLAAKPLLAKIVGHLRPHFDYISVLATDDRGLSYFALPGETRTAEPMWVQRGFVFRAQRDGKVAEYACAVLPGPQGAPYTSAPKTPTGRPGTPVTPDAAAAAEEIRTHLEALLADPTLITFPQIPDEPATSEYLGEIEEDPFAANPEAILIRLAALREKLTDGKVVVMAQSRYECVDVSRLFLSPNRSLIQSFLWSQAYLFGVARRGQMSKMSYRPASGRKGLEILRTLEASVPELAQELSDLLDAVPMEPGEYEVILDPDMAGTLAHEAFGHGVETDMFFKKRARAVEYPGKRVGSDIVTMYDGAAGVDQTGSYLFDDEGVFSSKTCVIDKGILKSGISDTLSALALNIPRTGNGRREAFSHKAYARMTNTYFAPGTSNLDEMIASVKHGWKLSQLNSGMEDPRNWGIQLICMVGREIKDGKFTGRVASPIVCSGYVPDVLSAVSMVSGDFELGGSGACGKGHKEYAKVSSGGPYVKTKMRLG